MILARRKGDLWYIGGINGEPVEKDMILDISSLIPEGTELAIIQDGNGPAQLQAQSILSGKNSFKVHLEPYGGFVATTGLKTDYK